MSLDDAWANEREELRTAHLDDDLYAYLDERPTREELARDAELDARWQMETPC